MPSNLTSNTAEAQLPLQRRLPKGLRRSIPMKFSPSCKRMA
ncbi:hypothetical protein ACVXHA_12255 [Escherichia coli]